MSHPDIEPSCTEKCRSTIHGDVITDAITKRSISDADLCAFLNYVCTCCESVRDSAGRTALHVAASCGRTHLVKWLVHNRHANINAKDTESGYTPLHRSIFYGKIDTAIELVKLGANLTLLDSEGLSYIEHAMKDGLKPDLSGFVGELYVWGSNSNNSIGPQKARNTPELLDAFHKNHPNECIKQVCLDQFHSVIVTTSGKTYSCGHGQGGRLGLGILHTVISPKEIAFPEPHQGEPISCRNASISRDHSVFLGSDGNVYSCGLNTHFVLGIAPAPQQLLVPRQLKHLPSDLTGVCASTYHSVAWGPKVLYTWGLNAGQLGHKLNDKTTEKFIITPKAVKSINVNETNIKCVASSVGATVICTEKGDVYVLHEYQCRKIASRQLNAIQVGVIGGTLNSSLDTELKDNKNRELKVVVLNSSGMISLWQESDPQLCRCIFSLNRTINIKQVTININEILFVTNDGEAFRGVPRPRKKKTVIGDKEKQSEKSAFHKFLEREDCISVRLEKLPRIHRAVNIQSDPKGKDYCVIQAFLYRLFDFPDIVESELQNHLEILLDEADITDNIHDVVFKIGDRCFPAHSYIISSRSTYFAKLLEEKDKEVVTLKDFNPDIFEQFLRFIYTGNCELIKCGELKNEKLRRLCKKSPQNNENSDDVIEIDGSLSAFECYKQIKDTKPEKDGAKNPVRMLHEMAKKFGVSDLQNILSDLDMQRYTIKSKSGRALKPRPLRFKRSNFNSLLDVTVQCKDGKEIKAHKCILAARLEYFNSMFSVRWKGGEVSEITLPFPESIAESLLEYLYTDSLSMLDNNDVDHLFKILTLADQLLVERLKEQAEFLLTNSLNLKNAVQLLSFAHIYNAEKLKQCSMKFIVENITPFLELRTLEELDEVLLRELTECYFQENSQMWCRVITPYSTAETDEEIIKIGNNFPVNFNEEIDREKLVKSNQKRRSRTHKSSSSEKNLSVSLDNDFHFPDIVEKEPHKQTQPKDGVAIRLSAISSARVKLQQEEIHEDFFKLSLNKSKDADLSSSFTDGFQFPELNSPPNSSFHYKTPQKSESKHKMVKLSQKQRKRLSSESANPTTIVSESPKNPWKIVPEVTSPGTSLKDNGIGDIISDERKQKENFVKIKSKLLIYTQIEDKAIDELHRFYNSEEITDEIITIDRVAIGAIASPVWVPKMK